MLHKACETSNVDVGIHISTIHDVNLKDLVFFKPQCVNLALQTQPAAM